MRSIQDFWPGSRPQSTYSVLPHENSFTDEKTDEENDIASLQPTERIPPQQPALVSSKLLFWTSVSVNLILILVFARQAFLPEKLPRYSFEAGYRTELAAARKYIEIEEKRFDGSGEFDDAGHVILRPSEGQLQYVGEPTKEIDEAWDKLTEKRYFMISEDEARDAWPGEDVSEFYDPINGGYVAGIEAFHILHCVGQLRETLYPEYYGHKHAAHLNHCIEGIRQYIMCGADLTPIPTRFYKGANSTYIESDLVHTCRNYERLQDFLAERRTGPTAVMPLYHPYRDD